MRPEWIPLSAGALVTGAMSLVLGILLDPSTSADGPAAVLRVAADSSGRWLAMSVLYFVSTVGLVLGAPSILTLFTRRGRRIGVFAVAVFTLGAIGLTGMSALMVVARALALRDAVVPNLLDEVLAESGLQAMLSVWMFGFLGGILLLAVALFRARATPVWAPGLLLVFLVLIMTPWTGRIGGVVAVLSLAAGFTGIATTATGPERRAELAQAAA